MIGLSLHLHDGIDICGDECEVLARTSTASNGPLVDFRQLPTIEGQRTGGYTEVSVFLTWTLAESLRDQLDTLLHAKDVSEIEKDERGLVAASIEVQS